MPELEEEYIESDSSDNEEQHSQLVNFVSQLDSTQRVKPALRKEASSEVSEYTLTKGTSQKKDIINVKELAQVLGKKTGHVSVTKKLKEVTKKSKTLPKPLEKPVEERLKRAVGFENVKSQLRKWDAVVTRNALKDHIEFPLSRTSMKLQPSSSFLKQFKTSTPLEMEISKILKQDIQLEEKMEEDEFPLTLEEMLEKRKEMAQLRAKLSYKEAKAQRQSKIKSKKYHRILKREKIRQQLKEFELLQKTDPEAALKKLAELDKSRAAERASLRHRNTGQWAKNMAVRAKYDVESRKVLADQLKMSREITQKTQKNDSSDEEESFEPQLPASAFKNTLAVDKDNPWSISVSEEVSNFVSDYKKYWSEKNKETESTKEKVEKSANEQVEKKEDTVEHIENEADNKETQSVEVEPVPDLSVNKKENDSLEKVNGVDNKLKQSKKSKLKKLKRNKSLTNGELPSNSPKKIKTTPSVSIYPTSGVWIVTPAVEETNAEEEKKEVDIDSLFEDLSEKLLKKGAKKIKKIKRRELKEKGKKLTNEEDQDPEFDLTLKHQSAAQRPDMDVGLLEGNEDDTERNSVPVAETTSSSYSIAEIDPKNFIQVKPKKLNSHLPDNITGGDDAVDDETQQQMTIEEAFGDDDVIAEFQEMKKEEEKARKIEINTTLPGWGEWGGVGIVPNKRKRRRLIFNLPPRKDQQKKDVIISESENPNLRKHLVKDVPHPFKSVDAFEANIRAPVGRDWVPETAHRSLIQKQVETKLGTIIDPMDEDEIVRLKKKSKSPYQGKKKTSAT